SEGTNHLIASGQAIMWLGDMMQTEQSNDPLIQLISNEPLTIDQLARKLNKPIAEIGAAVSLLQLSGQIFERGGVYYKK
ncbi:MAG TPA: hypothetical protein VJB62_00675, partial [Patescibacteria group bacterium]|nr:hypothetical protein [Patescibacteria group bacterium]